MQMSKRRPFVAGNWKMNGSRAESAALLDALKAGISSASKAEVAVCPPYILIPLAAEKLAGSAVAWGGQNLNVNKSGAFTGEISGPMLKDFGSSYVIVGHSERRTLYGETDAVVADKYGAAQANGLVPILCVGETLAEREANQTEAVVARQLDAVMAKHGVASLKNARQDRNAAAGPGRASLHSRAHREAGQDGGRWRAHSLRRQHEGFECEGVDRPAGHRWRTDRWRFAGRGRVSDHLPRRRTGWFPSSASAKR